MRDGAHTHGGGGVAAGFAVVVAVAFVVEVLADWLWLMLACTVAAGAGLVVLGVRANRSMRRIAAPGAAGPQHLSARLEGGNRSQPRVQSNQAPPLPQHVHYHQHLHVHPAELAGNPDPKENPRHG